VSRGSSLCTGDARNGLPAAAARLLHRLARDLPMLKTLT
jgi:hypothetical protein